MNAPQRYVEWLSNNRHQAESGHELHYHSRTDEHGKALSDFIWDDLIRMCEALAEDVKDGLITYKADFRYMWPGTGKKKTIDLAVGPVDPANNLAEVWISCELKSVMTEHGKSQPRLYDELQSSHAIVHAGNPDAIAAGLAVINIASRFASPLRQRRGQPIIYTRHRQPHVTERMVSHLRGLLPLRSGPQDRGFDAFCQVVIDCDNVGPATLWTDPPAPQPGEEDHYSTFIQRICDAYTARFHPRLRTGAT